MAFTDQHDQGEAVNASEYLKAQPEEQRIAGALSKIGEMLLASGRKIVVLDDDPTGVQSVHDVPVLTSWAPEDLQWAFTQQSPTFFILTNSRSLPENEAEAMNREIADALSQTAAKTDTEFVITSRSDSTLRGHYPAETDALREALKEARGQDIDGLILCPCFFEAGRFTIDDVHWVQQDEQFVPAGATEFASDHSFGYSSSNLREWVCEKTKGEIQSSDVVSIELADIRQGGPDRVSGLLQGLGGGKPVIVNAVSYSDLEIFILGLLEAEGAGKHFLYRTGPSFVRVRGGITEASALSPAELYGKRPRRGHGLVLVGSYVPTTTKQLEEALSLEGITAIELSVKRLLDPNEQRTEIDRVVSEANEALTSSEVIVYTSRELVTADDMPNSVKDSKMTNLGIGGLVSDALVETMKRIDRSLALSFVVAKGGITSSDVGTQGLGVRRAEVAGPLLPPGIVPVWILSEDNDFLGLPYVIFPGNVGGSDSLAQAIKVLREEA